MSKIFSEFFTSFAVAWASAGIISPFLTNSPVVNPAQFIVFGLCAALISLGFAIMSLRIKD